MRPPPRAPCVNVEITVHRMKLRAWVTLLPIGSYGLTQTRKPLTPSSAPTRPNSHCVEYAKCRGPRPSVVSIIEAFYRGSGSSNSHASCVCAYSIAHTWWISGKNRWRVALLVAPAKRPNRGGVRKIKRLNAGIVKGEDGEGGRVGDRECCERLYQNAAALKWRIAAQVARNYRTEPLRPRRGIEQ